MAACALAAVLGVVAFATPSFWSVVTAPPTIQVTVCHSDPDPSRRRAMLEKVEASERKALGIGA
jgi:hypothetical protein